MKSSANSKQDNQIDKVATMMILYLIAIFAMMVGVVWFIISFWKVSLFLAITGFIIYKIK